MSNEPINSQNDIVNAIDRLRYSIENMNFDREEWHVVGAAGEPAFENSWTHYDGDAAAQWGLVKFMKDANGFVHLRGLIKSGSSASATMFTLPIGYRPSPSQALFATIANDAVARINIAPSGAINGGAGASTSWTSLYPIIFKAGA